MRKLLALLLCVPLLASLATADPPKKPRKLDPELSKASPATEDTQKPRKLDPEVNKEGREAALGLGKSHPMVLAEVAFARTSVEKGMREAFLTYLSEDAVIFRPKPVGGRQWFAEHDNITAELNWEPTYIEVASSNDLGFSTGPFQYNQSATENNKTPVVQHGHFVSVWEKQSTDWRVVVDHGIPHREPRKKAKLEVEVRDGGPMGTLAESIPALSRIDKKFANVTSLELLQELYDTHGADDLRIYRRNFLPITGKKHALKALPQLSVLVSGGLEGAGLSKNGDLAYSYGKGTMGKVDKDQRSPATYLRLWRNDGGQNWKLMLDLVVPLPRERSAPSS